MSQENLQPSPPPSALHRWLGRTLRIVGLLIVYLLIFDMVAWLGLKLAGRRETPSTDPKLLYPGAS